MRLKLKLYVKCTMTWPHTV